MQNASNPGDHHNTRQQRDDRAFQPLLWWIFLGGLLIVIGLGIYSYFYPNVTERFKFWVGTSTQALILTAIVVQIYIYRRQWEAMRTQAGHMENTLAATEKAANAASVKYKDVFDHLHHSRHRGTYNPGNGTFRVDELESD